MKNFAVLLIIMLMGFLFIGTGWAEESVAVVDMELSDLNRGMTYAQMIQVCHAPEDYEGQTFRVRGQFNYSETQEVAWIIFVDNTGCCELAMKFSLASPLLYPDDYPPLYSEIVITAQLVIDPENPDIPCRFADALIEWEQSI